MSNPFLLERPALLAFSGGRTSGYMLRRVLDAFGGSLPEGVRVVFCNTGKERTETLQFVRNVGLRWGVPIVWLEYRYEAPVVCPTRSPAYRYLPLARRRELWAAWEEEMRPHREAGARAAHRHAVVSYEEASWQGEPFEELIAARQFLPNRLDGRGGREGRDVLQLHRLREP